MFQQRWPYQTSRKAEKPDGEEVEITPDENDFSAFVFKLQANMNPKHRDCVAFFRINSGRFEKDMNVKHERMQKKSLPIVCLCTTVSRVC